MNVFFSSSIFSIASASCASVSLPGRADGGGGLVAGGGAVVALAGEDKSAGLTEEEVPVEDEDA